MFGICTAALAALTLSGTRAHTVVTSGGAGEGGVRATGQAVLLRSDAEEDPIGPCSFCPSGLTVPADTPTSGNYTLAVVGNNGLPAEAFPLGLCQGDCDDDSKECEAGLKCFSREAGGPLPPGCAGHPSAAGRADKGDDFCYEPGAELAVVGNNGLPAEAFPLGICQGDCDDDSQECEAGLECFSREAGGPLPPGCAGHPSAAGRADKGDDFCYDPVADTCGALLAARVATANQTCGDRTADFLASAARRCCPAEVTDNRSIETNATSAPTKAPTKAVPATSSPTKAPAKEVPATPAPTKATEPDALKSASAHASAATAALLLCGAAAHLMSWG